MITVSVFRDALITSSINCFTSFFAGFAVFTVLGHMATIQGKEVKDVARSGQFYIRTRSLLLTMCYLFLKKNNQYSVIN